MTDNTPFTEPTHGEAIFALVDCRGQKSLLTIYQMNGGVLIAVNEMNAAVWKWSYDPMRFSLADEGDDDGSELPPDEGRRRGRGRRP